jgi:hypothetical protein
MLSRRAVLVSALGAAARPALGQTAARPGETAAPMTVLRAQSRTIEVNGKPASVLGSR